MEGLQGDDELTSITLDGQGTDVGEYAIKAYDARIGENLDSPHNYSITYVDGTLRIKKVFVITFDPNGGTLRGKTEPTTMECMDGEVITIVEAPTCEGYDFLYWKGSEYQPGDKYTVTEDHTFIAQWSDPDEPSKPDSDPDEEEDKPSKNNSDKKSSNSSKTNKAGTENKTGDHGMASWFLLLTFSLVVILVLLGKKRRMGSSR